MRAKGTEYIEFPDASLLTYDEELLVYAARWMLANPDAKYAPQPYEILYRDMEWDYQVGLVKNALLHMLQVKEGKK